MSPLGPKRLAKARARRALSVAFAVTVVAMAGPACNNLLNITQLALRSPDASDGDGMTGPGDDTGTDGAVPGDGGPGSPDATDGNPSSDSGGPDGGMEAGDGGTEADAEPGCLSTTPCTLPDASCLLGAISCEGGTACVARGPVSDGTPCGGDDAGLVCSNGSCVACTAGLDCSEAGSCQKMQISCGTGPQCTAAGNQQDGTPCGNDLYCNGGQCKSCTPGAACVPTGNPCHTGTVSCTGGTLSCSDTGMSADAGTYCGVNEVCLGGQCVPCTSGSSCPPANVCLTGQTSCATGTQTCTTTGNAATGTACDAGNLCMQVSSCASGVCVGSDPITCTPSDQCHAAGICDPSSGACSKPVATTGTPCNDDNACTTNDECAGGTCSGIAVTCPPLDACHTAGSCTSGACGGYGYAPNGTACSFSGGNVCYNGACMPCTKNAPCNPGGNVCQTGTTVCTSGQPVCATPTNDNGISCTAVANGTCCGGSCVGTTNNSSACGTTCRVCPSGSTCQNSQCTVLYGDSTEFAPCGTAVTFIQPGLMVAQAVSIPTTVTLTALGAVATAGGPQAIMALYADNGSGAPGALKTESSAVTLATGSNVFPVSNVTLAPATYWIAAEFGSNASICNDGSKATSVPYVTGTYPFLPSPFGTAMHQASYPNFNFYVVATE